MSSSPIGALKPADLFQQIEDKNFRAGDIALNDFPAYVQLKDYIQLQLQKSPENTSRQSNKPGGDNSFQKLDLDEAESY